MPPSARCSTRPSEQARRRAHAVGGQLLAHAAQHQPLQVALHHRHGLAEALQLQRAPRRGGEALLLDPGAVQCGDLAGQAEDAGRHHRRAGVHHVEVAHQRCVEVGGDACHRGVGERRVHPGGDLAHIGACRTRATPGRRWHSPRRLARAVEAALVVVEAAARRVPFAADVHREVGLGDQRGSRVRARVWSGCRAASTADAEHVVGVEGAAVGDDAAGHESRSRRVRATTLVARRRSSRCRRSSARLAFDSSTVRGPAP